MREAHDGRMITVLHAPSFTELDLDELAHDIARCGITSFEPSIRAVADAAERAGACRLLVALLTDQSAARVARERAFGQLATTLARRTGAAVTPTRLCRVGTASMSWLQHRGGAEHDVDGAGRRGARFECRVRLGAGRRSVVRSPSMKVDGGIGTNLHEVPEQAKEAERAGYSGVWTAETSARPVLPAAARRRAHARRSSSGRRSRSRSHATR